MPENNLNAEEKGTKGEGTKVGGETKTDIKDEKQGAAQEVSNNYDELFAKLDGAMERRFDSLTRSMLKGNGVADDDLSELAGAYKNYRNEKTQKREQDFQTMQAENSSLKAQITKLQIDSIAREQANALGIDEKKVGYVTKLADVSNCLNGSGEPDTEKIAEAIKKVVEDIPEFKKSSTEQTGFVKVGVGNGTDEKTSSDDRLRRAFGLK